MSEPRYTTPAEEDRIRRGVRHIVDDAIENPGDEFIVSRYTYFFRTVFNNMLRDRQELRNANLRSPVVVAPRPDAPDCPQGAAMPDCGTRAAE